MSSKKIWQYPEATSITNDDYILMDSNTETGSQCLKANKIGAVHITKTVTERKVYKASDDNANGFSEVTVAVPYTDVHYDKDDIVSFVGEDLPLKSVTAYIEPQQDLHGYDSPWVGGAGKNKFDVDLPHEEVSGSATYSYTVTVKANTNYTMSCNVPQGSPASLYFNGTATNVNDVWNGMPRTFTSDSSGQFIVYVRYDTSQGGIDLYTAVKNGTYYIQLEEGSTATSFAPYSNICPISGWSAVDVTRCGKNLFDKNNYKFIANGYIDGNSTQWTGSRTIKEYPTDSLSNYWNSPLIDVTLLKGKTITFSGFISERGVARGLVDENFNVLTAIGTSGVASQTIDLSQYPTAKYLVLSFVKSNYNFDNAQLELGSTATTYEPYNPNSETITIQLGDTYYGGTLDVVSGVLTVDRAYVDLGDLYWSYTSDAKLFTANIQGIKSGVYTDTNLISSIYPVKPMSYSQFDYGIRYNSATSIGVKDERYTDASAFKTAMNGVQLVYELATPLTIQLTPTQVSSLMGVNNVWADTGEIAVEWQTLYVTPTT